MILLNNRYELVVAKVDRCKIHTCNLYQLIMQNQATKEITIFKLRDYAQSNPLYYHFRFLLPDWLEFGDYKAYLVRNNDWIPQTINKENVENTYRMTDKTAISHDGLYLISDNKLVVTKNFKARLSDASSKSIQDKDFELVVVGESQDLRETGEIHTQLDVIHTDLIKYKPQNTDDIDFIAPTRPKQQLQYKEHKRQ